MNENASTDLAAFSNGSSSFSFPVASAFSVLGDAPCSFRYIIRRVAAAVLTTSDLGGAAALV